MKTLHTLATLTLLGSISSLFAANAAITALHVESDISHVNHNSSVWNDAKFSDIVLYPQTTIRMNDQRANRLNAQNRAKKAQVAAVYNDKNIAFMIKWPDSTVNIQQGKRTDSYADGFAMQFASDYSKPNELPYIGMGSKGREVVVHLQKAAKGVYEPNGRGNVYYQQNPQQIAEFQNKLIEYNKKVKSHGSNDYERSFVSEGFRSMTEIKDGSNHSYARIGYSEGGWKGTVSRPLKDEYVNLDSGAIPVAFAVWDGAKMGRDGIKLLTSWLSVKLDSKSGGEELIDALSPELLGDPDSGREAVEVNGCVGCHQFEADESKNLMAPSLSNIGGYATSGYLLESLKNPSAVVVAGYNRNAHSNYMWYRVENGKRVSTMTDYSFLDEKTMNDIVAYLQTLKAEVE